MLYVSKRKMRQGCSSSRSLLEIDMLFISGLDYVKKEVIHDYLCENPYSICVNVSPFPYLIPKTSLNGEKFVQSSPNHFQMDNLLSLPQE